MWAKIDDGFFRHPKARAAGKDGRALFIAGLCWSAAQLSDGFIAKPELGLIAAEAEVSAAKTSKRLVEIGMWETAEGGWMIHDYHLFNPSAEEVRERRKKRAEAGRIGGLRSKPPGSKPEANTEASASEIGTKTEAKPKPNRTPSPYPSPIDEPFTVNPPFTGQTSAAGDLIIDQATRLVANTETERRKSAGQLGNPSGYLRSRLGPLRAMHEPFWLSVLELEPMSTPEQLVAALERRQPSTTTVTSCDDCGWTIDSAIPHTRTHSEWIAGIADTPPEGKVIDLMRNLERSVEAAKKARPPKDAG